MQRLLVLTLLLLSTTACRALDVQSAIWGFDNKVTIDRFNPLSLLVSNSSPAPFDGTLELHGTRGFNGRAGALFTQQVYIAPFTSRWVQFYPYASQEPKWVLSWGRRQGESYEVPQATFGSPAQVEFTSPSHPVAGKTKLKMFPDDLFPPTVAATDGLDSVALDYAPHWEAAQREAFLDWLQRGGTLHLLYGVDGKYPDFPGDLSALNNPLDHFTVGNGRVIRHPYGRGDAGSVFSDTPASRFDDQNQGGVIYDLDRTFLENLVSFTRPHIHWGMIITLTIVYVIVIGPVHYFWGRKRNYSMVIGALLLAVAGFAWMFAAIGRRGHGEAASVYSVSLARSLGGDRYDVTQWVNTFVVHGGIYRISHPSAQNLYSMDPFGIENINAVVQNGKDGYASADIPLFSSSSLVHRAVMKGDNTGMKVLSWKSDGKLDELNLETGEGFPKVVVEIWARHRDLYYPMKMQDGRIVLAGPGEESEKIFNRGTLQSGLNVYQNNFPGDQDEAQKPDETETFRRFILPLMARAVGSEVLFRPIIPPPLPDDHAQLFIFARSPQGFAAQEPGTDSETGYVLYQQEIVKPSL